MKQSVINKKKLALLLSKECDWTQKQSLLFIEDCFKWIKDSLKKTHKITLSGFGTFKLNERKERRLIHPESKKEMILKKRLAPQFTAAKKVIQQLNKGG